MYGISFDETPRGRRRHTGEGIVKGLVGGSGYALAELECEPQAAVTRGSLRRRYPAHRRLEHRGAFPARARNATSDLLSAEALPRR
jgi:hypothetical protein